MCRKYLFGSAEYAFIQRRLHICLQVGPDGAPRPSVWKYHPFAYANASYMTYDSGGFRRGAKGRLYPDSDHFFQKHYILDNFLSKSANFPRGGGGASKADAGSATV